MLLSLALGRPWLETIFEYGKNWSLVCTVRWFRNVVQLLHPHSVVRGPTQSRKHHQVHYVYCHRMAIACSVAPQHSSSSQASQQIGAAGLLSQNRLRCTAAKTGPRIEYNRDRQQTRHYR